MQIGNLNLGKYPVIPAPMEDVTNQPFRLLCREFGADMVFTEFVSADALIRSVNRSLQKIQIADKERPVAIQIYGKDVDAMVEAAKVAAISKPELIDINFGCPVKKVASKGAGAGLLKNIPLLLKITEQVVRSVNIPVGVKTRLGWDDNSKIIVELAEKLQDAGIQVLAIHGRTRCQMFKGKADWTLIGEVKNNPRMKIPIIGNGDIDSPQKAKEAFENYGVDGIMVGRACIGKPWIFREIKHYLQKNELLPELDLASQVKILKRQIDASIEMIDERRGILHSRRHIAKMFKGLPHFKELRVRLLRANKYDEVMYILDEIVERYR